MASVELHSAHTTTLDPSAAAEDLVKQLGDITPKLVLLFASRDRDQVALNHAVRERLPQGTRLVGATTGGEIDKQGFHRGSVVLSALTGDLEVGLGVGKGLSVDAMRAGSTAVAQACAELGVSTAEIDGPEFVGLVMDDAYQYKKEELLLGMLEANAGLMLVGGGAADHEYDPAKQSALIHVDGEVLGDAAFIVLFRTKAPWAALRSHWYQPTGKTLRITKVDATYQRALEIDGKPAADRYIELLGGGLEPADLEFGKPRGFATMPTALRVGREYFMRSPLKAEDDKSILFVNLLEENSELELMKIEDMVDSTRRFLTEEIPRRVQSPKAALFFHCGGRIWFANACGVLDQLSETFKAGPPCAGLTAAFEIYCGFNINTTLTALVFGASA
jgi:hypothetical protein